MGYNGRPKTTSTRSISFDLGVFEAMEQRRAELRLTRSKYLSAAFEHKLGLQSHPELFVHVDVRKRPKRWDTENVSVTADTTLQASANRRGCITQSVSLDNKLLEHIERCRKRLKMTRSELTSAVLQDTLGIVPHPEIIPMHPARGGTGSGRSEARSA